MAMHTCQCFRAVLERIVYTTVRDSKKHEIASHVEGGRLPVNGGYLGLLCLIIDGLLRCLHLWEGSTCYGSCHD